MVSDLSTTTPLHPMMGWRYSLTRCLGRTSLADVYWARDLEVKDTTQPQAHVLLLKVSSVLSQLTGFEDALYDVLMPFTEPSSPVLPTVTDSGNDNGTLWLVMPHTEGKLLSDSLQGGKDNKRLLPELKPYLNVIATGLTQLKPPTYGFLEPAVLQFYADQVRFLNAPLVYALRHYIEQNATKADYRLTLNSGYISPAVAVGDVPQPEDDVFSLACMTYHFLTGEAPFKKQHTLEAVVRHTQVSVIKGLPTHVQEALYQGLTLQPGIRQATPALFISQLTKRSSHTNKLLPTAVAAAVAITGLAVHHLVQRAENYLDQQTATRAEAKSTLSHEPKPHPEAVTAPQPSTSQGLALQPDLTQAQIGANLSTTSAIESNTVAITELERLTTELKQQISLGKLAHLAPLVTKIKQQLGHTTQRQEWIALLEQVLQHEHQQAQSLLNNNDLNAANTRLAQSGQWIREFSLAEQNLKQLSLEQQLRTDQAEQLAIEQLLAQAQEAINQQRWTDTNGTQNAAAFLTQVLARQAQHSEAKQLLLAAVKNQHQAIQQQITTKSIQATQMLLAETAVLISKHNLEPALTHQIQLESDYQTLIMTQPTLVQPNATAPTPVVAAPDPTPNQPNTVNTALSAQSLTQAIEQAATITVFTPIATTQAPPKNDTDPKAKETRITTTALAKQTAPSLERAEPIAVAQRPNTSRQPITTVRAQPTSSTARVMQQPINHRSPPARPVQTPRSIAPNHRPTRPNYQPYRAAEDVEPMRRADRAYAEPIQPRRLPPTPQYRNPSMRAQAPRSQPYSPPIESVDELIEVPLSTILD